MQRYDAEDLTRLRLTARGAALATRYRDGVSAARLAAELHVSPSRLRRFLRAEGVALRPPARAPEGRDAEIAARRRAGQTYREIAAAYGISLVRARQLALRAERMDR